MTHLSQNALAVNFNALTLCLDHVDSSCRDINKHISAISDDMKKHYNDFVSEVGRTRSQYRSLATKVTNLEERIMLQRSEITVKDAGRYVWLGFFLGVMMIALGGYMGLRR